MSEPQRNDRRRELLYEQRRNEGAQSALMVLGVTNLFITVELIFLRAPWAMAFVLISSAQSLLGTTYLWWLRRRIWKRIDVLNAEEQAERDRAEGYVLVRPN